jgi:hypothetical protein
MEDLRPSARWKSAIADQLPMFRMSRVGELDVWTVKVVSMCYWAVYWGSV